MATFSAVFSPNQELYSGAPTLTGIIASAGTSGAIVLGKHVMFRLFIWSGTSAIAVNPGVLRVTFGLSTGTVAATPTNASFAFVGNQVLEFDMGDAYDEINLSNVAADNDSLAINYSIVPLSKF